MAKESGSGQRSAQPALNGNGFSLWKFVLILAVGLWSFYPENPNYVVCSSSGHIYTVDESLPQVECIHVKGTRIHDTGSLAKFTNSPTTSLLGLERLAKVLHTPKEPIFVPEGAIVVPGLTDAHAHVIENGFKMQLQLDTAKSVAEVVGSVKQYIKSHPDVEKNHSAWIGGMGWDQTKWRGAQFPTAADLNQDPDLKGRPIALRRVDGHAVWVSPRVLEIMGDLPEKVEGGDIIRDAQGRPTGVFLDNAQQLVPQPPWSDRQINEFARITIEEALSYGLTSIHDAATEPYMIDFWKQQAKKGSLPLRLYLMGFSFSEGYWGPEIPRLIDYGKHKRLTIRSIKLFSDGALGSWGAALRKPYSDKPETSGILLSPPDALEKQVRQFWKDGFQVNIHCIGDLANHVVLDIFEKMINGTDLSPVDVNNWRPRIEHAQIMSPDDLVRVGKLGVITSVQPTHATSDMWYAQTRLGKERTKNAYAYQTLLQASPKHVLPLGSDFPVESVNPLKGFYAAVSRLSVEGTSPHGEGGWYPDQRLTRAQALKGMTLDPAYASFAEKDLGSLVPGKKADFTKVHATVIDGKVAYGSLEGK